MSPARRAIISAAVAVAALGVGACAPTGSEPTVTTVTATTTVEPAPPETGTETPAPGQEAAAGAKPGDDAGVLEVTARGDQGVLGLQYSGSVPAGTPGPASGKLITGPGGCFALVGAGAPQLAIFPPDTTFVLQNGKPSATVDGVEHVVGRAFDSETTVLPVDRVAGVPERCTNGSADTVLVVG